MKARGILYSPAMIRAKMDGRKSQTRRVVKHKISGDPEFIETLYHHQRGVETQAYFVYGDDDRRYGVKCPYGNVGDILYARERWMKNPTKTGWPYFYYADDDVFTNKDNEKWKPSIHMPKEAARIIDEITAIRVERVQDISGDDLKAEGLSHTIGYDPILYEQWRELWIKTYGEGSWNRNDWVWVIETKNLSVTGWDNMK